MTDMRDIEMMKRPYSDINKFYEYFQHNENSRNDDRAHDVIHDLVKLVLQKLRLYEEITDDSILEVYYKHVGNHNYGNQEKEKVWMNISRKLVNDILNDNSLIADTLATTEYVQLILNHADSYYEKNYAFACRFDECKDIKRGDRIKATRIVDGITDEFIVIGKALEYAEKISDTHVRYFNIENVKLHDISIVEANHGIPKVENMNILNEVIFSDEYNTPSCYDFLAHLFDGEFELDNDDGKERYMYDTRIRLNIFDIIKPNDPDVDKWQYDVRMICSLLEHPSKITSISYGKSYEEYDENYYKEYAPYNPCDGNCSDCHEEYCGGYYNEDGDYGEWVQTYEDHKIDLTTEENKNLRIEIVNKLTKAFYRAKRLGKINTKFIKI